MNKKIKLVYILGHNEINTKEFAEQYAQHWIQENKSIKKEKPVNLNGSFYKIQQELQRELLREDSIYFTYPGDKIMPYNQRVCIIDTLDGLYNKSIKFFILKNLHQEKKSKFKLILLLQTHLPGYNIKKSTAFINRIQNNSTKTWIYLPNNSSIPIINTENYQDFVNHFNK